MLKVELPPTTRPNARRHVAKLSPKRNVGLRLAQFLPPVGDGAGRIGESVHEKCRRLWKNCERKLSTSRSMVVLAFLALLLKRL